MTTEEEALVIIVREIQSRLKTGRFTNEARANLGPGDPQRDLENVRQRLMGLGSKATSLLSLGEK